MHLCLVTETYPPEVNGVARTLATLTRGMALRHHRVTIVRPRQSSNDPTRTEPLDPPNDHAPHDDARKNPISLEHITVPGLPLPGYDGLHMGLPVYRRLRKLWKHDRPDVVHIATEGPLGLAALFAAVHRHIPRFSTFHTNFHQYTKHYSGFGYRIATAYLRWFHNRTRFTLAPSQTVIDALAQSGFANLGMVARGVDGKLFNPQRRSTELRRQWGADDDSPVVIYVGRIAAEKNIPLAAKMFQAMRQVNDKAKFVLVGDGPWRQRLQQQHPDYLFAGMRKGEDLAAHYASGDLFIFPSETETFGNVVTEAMASGLIVTAYDYAAARQIIRHGHNGYVAELGDEQALIEAACQAMRESDRWGELRQQAARAAAALTWDSILDTYQGFIEQTISDPTDQADQAGQRLSPPRGEA